MLRRLILAAVMCGPWCTWAADLSGTITILEGDAFIYRGASRMYANEGVRLQSGDIIETAAPGFMQVELNDLSVVQFGPATRAMINAPAGRQKSERWLFVMNGWCKVTGSKAGTADGVEVRTPLFTMPPNTGVVVFAQTPADTTLFVERGEVRLTEEKTARVSLKSDDYYWRKAGARGVVNAGSNEAFVRTMPPAFRESLPPRLDQYRDQAVQPKEAPDFTYAEVEPWLTAEPWLRRPLVQRWRTKAKDPAFRAALIAGLASHPEWDPILFPEKYKRKPSASPAQATGGRSMPGPLPAPARPAGEAASPPSAQ